MTKIGDIITDENGSLYASTAIWCNENGAYLEEIDPVEKEVEEEFSEPDETGLEITKTKTVTRIFRQFKVTQIPEPTEDEKKAFVRSARNQYLAETDKYMLADFPISEEERGQYSAYRQYLRDYTQQDGWFENNPPAFDEWRAGNGEV